MKYIHHELSNLIGRFKQTMGQSLIPSDVNNLYSTHSNLTFFQLSFTLHHFSLWVKKSHERNILGSDHVTARKVGAWLRVTPTKPAI